MRLKNGQRQAKITSLSEGTLEGGYNQLFEAGQIITITGISAGEHIFTINYYAPSALTSYSDTALLRDSSKPTQALSISCDPCFTFFQFVDYTDSLFGLLRIKNGQKQIKINSVSVGTKEGYDQIIEAGRIFSISKVPVGDNTFTINYYSYWDLFSYSDTGVLHIKPLVKVSLIPDELTITLDENKSIDILVQNNQGKDDNFSVTINPQEVSGVDILLNESLISIPANSQKTVKLYFHVKINQQLTDDLVINVQSKTNETIFDEETITLKVSLKTCPSCPSQTEWSDCVNNIQKRTNYRCSPETNYKCQSYIETQSCIPQCPTCPSPSDWSDCIEGKQTRSNFKCDVTTNYQCQIYIETRSCVTPVDKIFGCTGGYSFIAYTWYLDECEDITQKLSEIDEDGFTIHGVNRGTLIKTRFSENFEKIRIVGKTGQAVESDNVCLVIYRRDSDTKTYGSLDAELARKCFPTSSNIDETVTINTSQPLLFVTSNQNNIFIDYIELPETEKPTTTIQTTTTTIPIVPCSPCFGYFAFYDCTNGTLKLKNGPLFINSITATTGDGLPLIVSPTTVSHGDDIIISGLPTSGSVDIVITYTVTESGLTHMDRATIHNCMLLPEKEKPEIPKSCENDDDCSWVNTNCCPETSGAFWHCANGKTDIPCPSEVVCANVHSPRPTQNCGCINGRCKVYEVTKPVTPISKGVDKTTLLEVLVQAEQLRIRFDYLKRQTEQLADYYDSIGDTTNYRTWYKATSLFGQSIDGVDTIKNHIKMVKEQPTQVDVENIKTELETVIKNIDQIIETITG